MTKFLSKLMQESIYGTRDDTIPLNLSLSKLMQESIYGTRDDTIPSLSIG